MAVVRGSRVFIVTAPVAAKLGARPDCEPLWQEADQNAKCLLDEYMTSENDDETLLTRAASIRKGSDLAYRGCFAMRADKDDKFPALVAQAQALIDALPKE